MCKWLILSVKYVWQFSEKRRELPYIVIVRSKRLRIYTLPFIVKVLTFAP